MLELQEKEFNFAMKDGARSFYHGLHNVMKIQT